MALVLLAACSPNQSDSSKESNFRVNTEAETRALSANPSEWTQLEAQTFNAFTKVYKSTANMPTEGKRALMDNAYLICKAFSENYSRSQIQAVTTGDYFTAAMADDWMTLSVSAFCPKYMSKQLGR